MKYIIARADYMSDLLSKNNLMAAYKRIGEIDPFEVHRYTLSKKPKKNEGELTERQLIHRGMLNVRKRLNGHLGKSGKFTNTMLMRTATIKTIKKGDIVYIEATVPKKAYLNITMATYLTLWEHDKKTCAKLLGIEEDDDYPAQDINRKIPTKAVSPIQTNVFLRSIAQTQEAQEFIEYLKKVITQ